MSEASVAAGPAETGFGRMGRAVGLVLGPALAIGLQLLPRPEGLSPEAWITVSMASLMVVWWITEAVPLAATALIPLVILPFFGVRSGAETAQPYADPIIFLFIGGFMIAAAIERCGLHARIALQIASRVGAKPSALIGGFILAAGLLSMWISNTATALMLMPIAVGVVRAMAANGHDDPKFGAGLVLAVAYACTIGGIGTPVGSPTNLIGIAFLDSQGIELSFRQWMTLGVPVVALMLPALWVLSTRGLKRASAADAERGRAVLHEALEKLGPMSAAEKRVLAVFALVALAWMGRELLVTVPGLERLSDTGIAIAGALAMFILPAGDRSGGQTRLLDWGTAHNIPWGIVLLFGGGLSMASAMEATGLSEWLGGQLQAMQGLSPLLVVAVLVLVTVLVTELISNVASLTAMLPVVAVLAATLGIPPLALVFPVAIAASLAFMLPVATAANAIAYGTGLPTMRRMIAVGFGLNVVGVLVVLLISETLGKVVLGS